MAIQIFSTMNDKPHAYRFNETDNWLPFDPYEISRSDDGITYHSIYDDANLKDVYCGSIDIAKANPTDTLRTLAGTDGQSIDSTRYETRDIKLNFFARTHDSLDTDLVSNCLEQYFSSRDPYWIVIGGKYGCSYKRWLVKAAQITITEADEHWAIIQVPLTNLSGYAQSIVNSLAYMQDVDSYGGIGLNLLNETDPVQYTQTASSFKIYNPSDIKIDPLRQHHDITITVTGVGKPVITNTTNNTTFSFTKTLTASDKLQLIKVNPYLNGTQSGINSNHGWIELDSGYNNITVTGMSNLKITFDFAWYFLS